MSPRLSTGGTRSPPARPSFGDHLGSMIARLSGSLRSPRSVAPHESGAEPFLTVLDFGAGAVKALVIDVRASPATAIGGAAEAVPPGLPPPGAGETPAAFAAYAGAAERALSAAEDAAGVVPRVAVLAVPGAPVPFAGALATVDRRRPGAHLAPDEVEQALAAACAAAVARATRAASAELARPAPVEAAGRAVRGVRLDGESVGWPPGGDAGVAGECLEAEVEAGLASVAEVQRRRRLAEALDLDVAGTVSLPLALAESYGRRSEGAVLIDAGAGRTAVLVVAPGRPLRGATVPLGGAELEREVTTALGAEPETAREVLQAHAAGALRAGGPSAAGRGAARVVRGVAGRFGALWGDAVELALASLEGETPLPPTVLLCGGALAVPEVRRALQADGWGAQLSWARARRITLLRGVDASGIRDEAQGLPALLAPAALAAGAAAVALIRTP